MKIFKKLLAVFLASAMVCSAAALSACGNPDKEEEERNEFLNQITQQAINAVEIEAVGLTVTHSGDVTGTVTTDVNAKLDFRTGNGDVLYTNKYEAATVDATTYGYAFLREWELLVDENEYETEVTDYSQLNLKLIDISDIIGDETDMDLDLSTLPVGDLLGGGMGEANRLLSTFANAAGALTMENGAAVIDLNKAAYNFANDVKTLVNGITAETSIGQLLDNAILKKYATVFTELISIDEISLLIAQLVVYAQRFQTMTHEQIELLPEETRKIAELAQTLLKNVNIGALLNVKPDKNSSTYEYIVKILKSDEFNAVIAGVIANVIAQSPDGSAQLPFPANVKFTDISVGQILSLSAGDAEAVEDVLRNLRAQVEKTFESVKQNQIETFEYVFDGEAMVKLKKAISDARITYKMDNGKITTQSFAAKITESVDEEILKETEISVKMKYVTLVALADISNANIIVPSLPDLATL